MFCNYKGDCSPSASNNPIFYSHRLNVPCNAMHLILHSVRGAPPQSGITFLPQIPSSRSPAHPASHSLFFWLLPWAFCIKCRLEGALHFNIGDCSSPLSNSVLPSLPLPWPRFSYHSIGPTPTYSPTILCPPTRRFSSPLKRQASI